MKRKYTVLLAVLMFTLLSGCSSRKSTDSLQGTPGIDPAPTVIEEQGQKSDNEVITINVSSESLTSEGKWLTVINSTSANPPGSNLSPQLSWDEVEGAGCYAIYMIDTSASNWLHWLAKNVKENNLTLGAELENSRYKGPYPPSGTHEYEVIVYALKGAPDKYRGNFDSDNPSMNDIEKSLDTINGVSGNIIAKGSITGTVTAGESAE